MFTPPYAVTNEKTGNDPIRLGIQGAPGSFKTGALLTFPNVVLVDGDNGLKAHKGKPATVIPFWDDNFINALNGGMFKPKIKGARPNRKDALMFILDDIGFKLTREQTLGLDSWTILQDGFDLEQKLHPKITKSGEEDGFAFWGAKLDYARRLCSYVHSFACNVVVTFHESRQLDDKGNVISKLMPLMQGQFQTRIAEFFPDWYRATSKPLIDPKGNHTGAEFWWQVRSDQNFDAKCTMNLPQGVVKVEATYQSFVKYA